ncbi:hypothetical protein [Chryseolinea lacunae]|uniref:Uncharacterized protein n=1 Tax=Chryseolinea lacunae TaxID=2801331 RepID=A0ABS1L159_9BACT|nr:hypothetical protein [Chryseolinea lacunae]MBL0745262.1 hypothetical protein [Chryseolinea lacunae]
MKLIDLIEYLINPEKLKVLYENEKLSADSEGLLAYMQERLSLDSEIVFFKIEETEDMVYEHGGVRYVQFFPIDYAVELVRI